MAKELSCEIVRQEAVRVKKEAECMEEIEFSLKEEPEWETEGDADALSELYAGHAIKDELVLGPETLQEKDVASNYAKISPPQREILNTIKQHIFHEFDYREKVKTSLVKLEPNHDDIKLQCDDNQESFDYDFNVYTHLNTNITECKINNNDTGNCDSKMINDFKAATFKDCLSFHDDNKPELRRKFVDNKINLSESSAREVDYKEYQKHRLFPFKTSKKRNSILENQPKNYPNNDKTGSRESKKHKSKTNPFGTMKNKSKNCHKEKERDDFNKCEICKKSFVSLVNLIRHKQIHTGLKSHACKICNKEFVRKDYLKRHEETHLEQKLFKCEYCPKQYSDRSNFNRHTRYHTGEKLYTCETCGKQFGQKIHLVTHQLSHNGNKPYPCKVCRKEFTYKHRLIAHIRIHAGEKPFRCQICPKRFIAKCRLTRHEVLIHAARLRYICDVCKKEFNTKKEITKHTYKCFTLDRPNTKIN